MGSAAELSRLHHNPCCPPLHWNHPRRGLIRNLHQYNRRLGQTRTLLLGTASCECPSNPHGRSNWASVLRAGRRQTAAGIRGSEEKSRSENVNWGAVDWAGESSRLMNISRRSWIFMIFALQERLLLSVLPEHVAVKMRQDLGSNDSEQFKKIYMSRHENVR